MTWFKVDDNLAFHHKALAAGNAAMGMWVRAGSMCAQQLTDGFVPQHMVAALGGAALARRLVTAGLWSTVDGGYLFHQWDERQPTKESVEARRAEARERMRDVRSRGGSGSQPVRANSARTSDDVRTTPTRPDPTRPAAAAAEGAAAAASARVLHPAVEILRSKMQAHTALRALRFDTLTDAQQDEIVALIEVHGDAKLVSVAVRTLRAEPVILVTAFLGTWRALPPPGRRVAAVPSLPPASDTPVQTAEGVAAAREVFEQIRKGGASS